MSQKQEIEGHINKNVPKEDNNNETKKTRRIMSQSQKLSKSHQL